jgi:histidinol-phosphate/aromatic aminotransferase/cobyric acid decarboxylase-like protein
MQIFGKYEKEYASACYKIKHERQRLHEKLSAVKYLVPIPSHANFIVCRVKNNSRANEIADALLHRYNILAYDLWEEKGFKRTEYLRFSLRGTEDNDRLIDALKQLEG